MFKTKIIAVLSILFAAGIVLNNSHTFSISARSDIFEEIAQYKTWSKLNREPIRVELNLDFSGG